MQETKSSLSYENSIDVSERYITHVDLDYFKEVNEFPRIRLSDEKRLTI